MMFALLPLVLACPVCGQWYDLSAGDISLGTVGEGPTPWTAACGHSTSYARQQFNWRRSGEVWFPKPGRAEDSARFAALLRQHAADLLPWFKPRSNRVQVAIAIEPAASVEQIDYIVARGDR